MVEFQNYIEKGGVIFSLLLIMSAIGLTIILYKFFELYLLKNNEFKTFDNFLRESKTIAQFEQSLENLTDNRFLKEIANILQNKTQKILKMTKFYTNAKETEKMQRFMPTLEIIAQVSPLIGLLGTVIEMIDFNELELGEPS